VAAERVAVLFVIEGTLKRNAPTMETRDLWKPGPISKHFPAGRYTFCVVATDDAGNRAQSCVPYRVV